MITWSHDCYCPCFFSLSPMELANSIVTPIQIMFRMVHHPNPFFSQLADPSLFTSTPLPLRSMAMTSPTLHCHLMPVTSLGWLGCGYWEPQSNPSRDPSSPGGPLACFPRLMPSLVSSSITTELHPAPTLFIMSFSLGLLTHLLSGISQPRLSTHHSLIESFCGPLCYTIHHVVLHLASNGMHCWHLMMFELVQPYEPFLWLGTEHPIEDSKGTHLKQVHGSYAEVMPNSML